MTPPTSATGALPSPATDDLPTTGDPSERRYLRYRGLIEPSLLRNAHCGVVGVGAIGRQVAIQLASMGVGSLTIWDPDVVTDHNCGPQGYSPHDIDSPKVDALGVTLDYLNPSLHLHVHQGRWKPSESNDLTVIFACPDSIVVRRHIFETTTPALALIDGRMSAEALQVYCVPTGDTAKKERYESTLFAAGEAHPEPCTARATTYCAHFTASVMVAAFSSILRGFPTPFEWWGCVLSGELTPTH